MNLWDTLKAGKPWLGAAKTGRQRRDQDPSQGIGSERREFQLRKRASGFTQTGRFSSGVNLLRKRRAFRRSRRQTGLISDYLESLADVLRFDQSLAQRLRQEIEDHLREAVAADPAGDGLEAERRAVANFGDAHAIAAQFAVISLAQQISRFGGATILLIVGILIAMKVRVAWYAIMQWTTRDDVKAIGEFVGLIDRYAFLSSVVVAIVGWAYIGSSRMSAAFDAGYRRQLRRSFMLSVVATTALALSVLSDGVLTVLRLLATEFHSGALLPLVSMAIEVACVCVLAWHIRSIARRATSLAALLNA
ncbi:hypothetical protein OZ411_37870 [Bradyrhizobium sp. Arg237L]|uniref:hypothetical protein n=1 Tax=Bradyrhizobium sp. Arg237L TaxID=3003352 RepID=UPI00249E1861|nr:hypothetical protein [Bradyrhizobium sp. Arg237L]MDI4238571.1 hypothetical protein [Bradyrhizobium sp. Arg237L]